MSLTRAFVKSCILLDDLRKAVNKPEPSKSYIEKLLGRMERTCGRGPALRQFLKMLSPPDVQKLAAVLDLKN